MKFIYRAPRFTVVPWYYGYVRQLVDFNGNEMAIVPFHLLLRVWHLLRVAWAYFQWYGHDEDWRMLESQVVSARKKGYRVGKIHGMDEAEQRYQPIIEALAGAETELREVKQNMQAAEALLDAFKGTRPT